MAWFRPQPAPPDPAAGVDDDVRRQIQETRDLSVLVRGLGFDVKVSERARAAVAGLKATIRAEVDDIAALQAAVSAARSTVHSRSIRFEVADRELLEAVAAAGTERTAVLALLNRDPVSAQLPFVERIPVVKGGLLSWRTPVDYAIVRRRPTDQTAFERWLGELDDLFAEPQRPHREPLRQDVLDALGRVRRDGQREKAYLPTALQLLERHVDAFLSRGSTPSAPARFDQLVALVRRLTLAERAAAAGAPLDATAVTQIASEYTAAAWLQTSSLTHRAAALLLAPPYVSVSVWYRRRRFMRVLSLLRQEIAGGHYDRAEVARRLQQLEAGGAFFSSLVYPLLRTPQVSSKPRVPATVGR